MFHRLSPRASLSTTPRLIGMAFVIAIGLSVVAGAALVAAQRGEPGERDSADSYQGCVNTYTGVLRIISAGEQCADQEMPIQLAGSAADAALMERIKALESAVETLQQENAALHAQVPDCLSTDGIDAVFEGCNVHVRSGAGATDAAVNGLGNLIVGYNESSDNDARTGSHKLIVGEGHAYSSYGGLVTGYDNIITGEYSSVTGGIFNAASGFVSSIGGGYELEASADYQFLP